MALDTTGAAPLAPEGKENPLATSPQTVETKTPPAPLPASTGTPPPPEAPIDWKSEAEKWQKTAGSYKESAEKYWEIKKSGRLQELQPPTTPQPLETESVVTTPEVDENVVVTIRNDYLSKRQDVVDDFRTDVLNLTDEQYQRFKPLYRAVDELYDQAAKQQRFVAKGEISRRFKEMLDFAKGGQMKDAEKIASDARREGHIEMLKAEKADIAVASTTVTPKDSPGVTEEDKAESAKTGGYITPERAAEIRRRREERKREYAA